jgi:Zn-dependent protease with chaperone function
MPRTQEDVETFLLELGRTYETSGGTLVLAPHENRPPVAVRVQPPIVEIQMSIGAPPPAADRQLPMFRRLLELNATDLAHAAYALEEGQIVLTSSLSLDNLDKNELEAVLADIDMALLRHLGELRELAG